MVIAGTKNVRGCGVRASRIQSGCPATFLVIAKIPSGVSGTICCGLQAHGITAGAGPEACRLTCTSCGLPLSATTAHLPSGEIATPAAFCKSPATESAVSEDDVASGLAMYVS